MPAPPPDQTILFTVIPRAVRVGRGPLPVSVFVSPRLHGADRSPLQPRLWAALFKPTTLVRSHVFDDYSGRAIVSYSVRGALGTLKSIYQRAAVELALPDR